MCKDGENFNFGVIYCPPNCTDDALTELDAVFNIIGKNTCVIIGDFNFPGIDWDLNIPGHSRNSADFLNLCNSLSLRQLVTLPTHRSGSILDLVLTSDDSFLKNLSIELPFNDKCDHNSISFQIENYSLPDIAQTKIKVKNFFKANYHEMNLFLSSINYHEFFATCNTPENMFQEFFFLLQNIIDTYTPVIYKSNKFKFTEETKKAMYEKSKHTKHTNATIHQKIKPQLYEKLPFAEN